MELKTFTLLFDDVSASLKQAKSSWNNNESNAQVSKRNNNPHPDNHRENNNNGFQFSRTSSTIRICPFTDGQSQMRSPGQFPVLCLPA